MPLLWWCSLFLVTHVTLHLGFIMTSCYIHHLALLLQKKLLHQCTKKTLIDDQLFPSFFHNFIVLFQAKTINSTEEMLNECHWIFKRFGSRAGSCHIETIEIIYSENGEIPQDHSHTFVSFQWSSEPGNRNSKVLKSIRDLFFHL